MHSIDLKKIIEMNNKTVTTVGIIIIVLLLIASVIGFLSSNKKKRDLNAEKLRTETLLSEKLSVEKELDKLKSDFAALQKSFDENAKKLADTEARLSDRERRINSLVRANNTLTNASKELEALKTEKAALDKEYADLKLAQERLLNQNNDLQAAKTALEAEKSDLLKKIEQMQTYDADNYLPYGSRGKMDKPTIRAFWTKKLNVSFEVPQSLTDAVSFKITTPTGSVITPDNKALTWFIVQDPAHFTASLSAVSGEFEQSRTVVMNYASKEKLAKGEYKIEISSNGINIGNCRLKLK